jgi:uncharacterized phage-associated protein
LTKAWFAVSLLCDNCFKDGLNVITFKFNEKKTTQVAVLFIQKHGGEVNYTKLIKLLYLTDREALSHWGRPLTGDSYVSMPNGPVLSKTYDLINYAPDSDNESYWYKFISKNIYDVSLISESATDELSEREMNLIEQIYQQYKDKDWKQMIDICHKCCPEWEHPGDTSIPIRVEDILKELKKTEKEIEMIDEEVSNLKYFDYIMPRI